ncbi:hypothetical protein GOBAR_DD07314 [Gossypium barbadense]|nr:hypothetical protein GOBAR_DD07314 [Gossypium barbadense]
MAISRLLHPKPRGLHFNAREKVGQWFKGILSNIKQIILECPLFQKSNAREISDSKVDTEASEVTVTENKGVSSGSTSDTIEGNAFEGPVVNATSELHQIHYNPYKVGLSDIQSKVQPPEAVIVSHGNERMN